jgi:hypothetical protein
MQWHHPIILDNVEALLASEQECPDEGCDLQTDVFPHALASEPLRVECNTAGPIMVSSPSDGGSIIRQDEVLQSSGTAEGALCDS